MNTYHSLLKSLHSDRICWILSLTKRDPPSEARNRVERPMGPRMVPKRSRSLAFVRQPVQKRRAGLLSKWSKRCKWPSSLETHLDYRCMNVERSWIVRRCARGLSLPS